VLASPSDDPDDGCRKLAAACHAIFGGAVREQLRLFDDVSGGDR
jgi:hypothetical protein